MTKNNLFWRGQMVFAVLGWIFIFWGALACFSNPTLKAVWWVIVLLWALGHPLELVAALPTGKKAGISLERTIVMTLVFGITWWLPLKLGVFER